MMMNMHRRMDKLWAEVFFAGLLCLATAGPALSASIAGSKHDLSVGGEGPVASTSERQVCIFCHTPHRALAVGPLWNHSTTTTTFTLYSSSTSRSAPQQPKESTALCLSCHDGTVAIGNLAAGVRNVANTDPNGFLPPGRSNLGTTLADDHPVGVAVPAGRPGLSAPVAGDEVRLRWGKVECVSCHNPHDPSFAPFLVKAQLDLTGKSGGELCAACHRFDGWSNGAHAGAVAATLPATVGGAGAESVAQAACSACHATHSAGVGPRLLSSPTEAQCLLCHDGATATDVLATQAASSGHLQTRYWLHDPAEEYRGLPETQRHAGCADCHDPHAAAKSVPDVDGRLPASLRDVPGVQAHYIGEWSEPGLFPVLEAGAEYEVCFKCHSAYAFGTTSPVSPSRRAADGVGAPDQTSPATQFNPFNPGLHAVVAEHPRRLEAPAGSFVGVDRTGVPWSWESVLLCTDCHGSDDVYVRVRGVHGSGQPYILRGPWVHPDAMGGQAPGATGTFGTQDHLCFKCHDYRTYVDGSSANPGGTAFRQQGGGVLHGIPGHTDGCTNCHAALPHGYRRRGMLALETDPAPYNYGSKLRLPRDPTGDTVLPAPGEWTYSSCQTSCHLR